MLTSWIKKTKNMKDLLIFFLDWALIFVRAPPLCEGRRPIVISLSVRASGSNRVRPRDIIFFHIGL